MVRLPLQLYTSDNKRTFRAISSSIWQFRLYCIATLSYCCNKITMVGLQELTVGQVSGMIAAAVFVGMPDFRPAVLQYC